MSGQLAVLQSFPEPRATTNPYLVLLARSLKSTPGLTLYTFSWRRALLARFDVFHVHWPEHLLRSNSAWKSRVRQLLFVLLLLKLATMRVAVVRTVHNLSQHEGGSAVERRLLRAFDRVTTLRIALNNTTPDAGKPMVVIPHGHYRDWFEGVVVPPSEPGRLGYVGLIRSYKAVDTLIKAFIGLPERCDLRLDIAGKPSPAVLADELAVLAHGDDRITLRFDYISDDELADRVGRAEIVVLPVPRDAQLRRCPVGPLARPSSARTPQLGQRAAGRRGGPGLGTHLRAAHPSRTPRACAGTEPLEQRAAAPAPRCPGMDCGRRGARRGVPRGHPAARRADDAMTTAQPKARSQLAIVVVNYGSHVLLASNLVGLARELPDAIVVVVDNPTTTTEREAATALCETAGFLLVCPEDNVGFGAGMNEGVRRATDAGADTFLLLNPDAVIHADAVQVLVDRVAADPYLLVSPLIERPDGTVWFAGSHLYLSSGIARSQSRRPEHPRGEVEPWLSGCCLVVTAELWSLVGGFANGYFMYWEDVDLSYRVVRAGGRLRVETSAVAVHDVGGTQGAPEARGKSKTYYFYNTRNRLLFAARHLSVPAMLRWVLSSLPAGWEILTRGGRRQLVQSREPLSAALTGTAAGLSIVSRQLLRRVTDRQNPGDRITKS